MKNYYQTYLLIMAVHCVDRGLFGGACVWVVALISAEIVSEYLEERNRTEGDGNR